MLPVLYSTLPNFIHAEPLYFDIPIIASDLKNIKNIFGDSISYFSPISVNSIYEKIKLFIEKKDVVVDYEEIKQKYSKENTIKLSMSQIKESSVKE